MRRESVPKKAPSIAYWQRRAVETERKMACADSEKLRAVYLEFIQHYIRMASLSGESRLRLPSLHVYH